MNIYSVKAPQSYEKITNLRKKFWTMIDPILSSMIIIFSNLTMISTGVDPTKLFFFANKEFFRFSLVSLRFRNIQKKIIDSKMT